MSMKIAEPSSPRKRTGIVGIAILLIIIVSVIGYFVYQTISPGKAALLVEANPVSIVYINGEQRGKTPIEIEMKAEEVVVKLVPESYSVPLSPYETKVKLTEGVKTIVRRNFGESEVSESGQIISFEKTGADTSIAVVSVPDGIEVSIDGQTEGVTPLKLTSSPGDHTLKLSATDYEEATLKVKTIQGYTVTVVVDLAKTPGDETTEETVPAETPSDVLASEDAETNTIIILDTAVGYLRVRSDATVASEEIGRVNPGDKFEILEHDEEIDWYKIEFEEGNEGWVSGEFVSQTGTPQTDDE